MKTTMRYHLTTVRMSFINKSTNDKCWRGWEKGTLGPCWWECRWVQPLWKAVWSYLKRLKMELHYDPVIPVLGIYLKKLKANLKECKHPSAHWSDIYNRHAMEATQASINRQVDKKTVVHSCSAIILGRKKEWNLTICSSMDGPTGYYAQRNKSVRERQILYDFTYMWNLNNKTKLIDTENRLVVARGEGGWK